MLAFSARRRAIFKWLVIFIGIITITGVLVGFFLHHLVVLCPDELRSGIDTFLQNEQEQQSETVGNDVKTGQSLDFVFHINQKNVCDSTPVFLLAYIHSAPSRFERRAYVRSTWGHDKWRTAFRIKIVFILGRQVSESIQADIRKESETHGDVIQADFEDTYWNLTIKEAAGLSWVVTHCPQAEYVMKCDDDLVVQWWSLLPMLLNVPDRTSIICLVTPKGTYVRREPSDKWYVPADLYAPDYYPEYCSGPLRVYSRLAARKLHWSGALQRYHKVMPMEDVYWTGIVADRANIVRRNVPWLLNRYISAEDNSGVRYMAAHTPEFTTQSRLWEQAVAVLVEKFPCYRGFVD